MVEVILRCSEMDDGGMLMVNAGNSSDVTGCCFVLVMGLGGVKTIWEYRQLVVSQLSKGLNHHSLYMRTTRERL